MLSLGWKVLRATPQIFTGPFVFGTTGCKQYMLYFTLKKISHINSLPVMFHCNICSICGRSYVRGRLMNLTNVKPNVNVISRFSLWYSALAWSSVHKVNVRPNVNVRGFHKDSSKSEAYSTSNFTDDSWLTIEDGKLYKTHRPTTGLQKGILTMGSAFMAIYDPYRHDMVAVLGETTGHTALKRLHSLMLRHPDGQQILRERPRINTRTVDMNALSQLPDGTLGKEYQRFMTKNNITSDTRAAVQYVDDTELAYVMQRYREVHDFYHCLLDLPTNMLGEVVVKWFEMINTKLPMCALGALLGPIRLSTNRRRILREHYLPQVFRMAPKSELVLNCYFEKRWEDPLEDVRKDLQLRTISKRKTKPSSY